MSTRIFIEDALTEGTNLDLPDAAARHVGQVLRMRVGEGLSLFRGDGCEFDASIEAVERRRVAVRIGARREPARESPLDLGIAQCVSKGDRMDYTIQKAVELGVARIQPLESSRSVVRLDAERWEKKQEHWRGVAIAACEQSGRVRLPALADLTTLDRWLATPEPGLRLVLAPGATTSLKTLPPATAITLLVGPEGGLSEAEIRAAVAAGCLAIGLGPRVLRTETAGVAALAVLQALRGDLT